MHIHIYTNTCTRGPREVQTSTPIALVKRWMKTAKARRPN